MGNKKKHGIKSSSNDSAQAFTIKNKKYDKFLSLSDDEKGMYIQQIASKNDITNKEVVGHLLFRAIYNNEMDDESYKNIETILKYKPSLNVSNDIKNGILTTAISQYDVKLLKMLYDYVQDNPSEKITSPNHSIYSLCVSASFFHAPNLGQEINSELNIWEIIMSIYNPLLLKSVLNCFDYQLWKELGQIINNYIEQHPESIYDQNLVGDDSINCSELL